LLVGTYEDWGDEVLHLLSQERGLTGVTNTVEAGRKYHAAWVERTFSPLLAELRAAVRRRRIGQLVAVTDIYQWKVLRRDVGLSRREVEASLRELISDIVRAECVNGSLHFSDVGWWRQHLSLIHI